MTDLDDLIADAQARSAISELSDDTTLEPRLAAFYLGISTKKLEAMRSPTADAGLPFVKMMHPSSKGRNQLVFYKLGDLRDYQKSLKVQSSFHACINSGMADWTKSTRAFYAVRGSGHLLREVGDFDEQAEREFFFAQLFFKNLKIRRLTLYDALHAQWDDAQAQSNLRFAWINLLNTELNAVKAQ